MSADNVEKELQAIFNPTRASHSKSFFKTGPGQYGEGDIFLGLTVPSQRKIAIKYSDLNLGEVKKLLNSPIHEYRFTALEILVIKYESLKSDETVKRKILVDFYLDNTKNINNWDLVDTSAPYIIGDWLLNTKNPRLLFQLAKSTNIWERRIAMVATWAFIRQGQTETTLRLAKMLLNDKHDLIHKATGWMLREVGKKSPIKLVKFLEKYSQKMPRTMLRYAIERLPEKQRKSYLHANI